MESDVEIARSANPCYRPRLERTLAVTDSLMHDIAHAAALDIVHSLVIEQTGDRARVQEICYRAVKAALTTYEELADRRHKRLNPSPEPN
jgi:hypothetical protein